MKQLLLKAQAKKQQKQNKQKIEIENESDADLTSDDEVEVSKDVVGQIFNNRYFCLKYLGRGTFSRVWLVYDFIDNDYRAMKVQFPKYYQDSLHEIKIMKEINNNSNKDSRIVKLLDTFKIITTTYMIYELLGCSLLELFRNDQEDSDSEYSDNQSDNQSDNSSANSEIISDSDESYENYRNPQLTINIVKRIIKDLILGLSEVHKKGIIHTDLKPENIMINSFDPKVKKIIEWFSSKNPNKLYTDLITKYLPDNFYECDKNKRKKLKNKAKIKALNCFKEKFNISEILNKFNNEDIDIDYENIQAKIVDFGNGEFENDLLQDQISLRCYRCPENIINEYYNTKSDIWAIGCICYELLTNEYLFDISKNKKSIDRNREHLHQMYEILGKMPKSLTDECDFGEDYFDTKARIIKYKQYDHVPISNILITEFGYSENDSIKIEEFLLKLLEYDPIKRLSALECLELEWLNII